VWVAALNEYPILFARFRISLYRPNISLDAFGRLALAKSNNINKLTSLHADR